MDALEDGLRRALERSELAIHHQSIVSLATGALTGCEALVRWNHPQRGLLAAAEFILIAEETGLIHAIDDWVLRMACAQHGRAGLAELDLMVNVSAKQVNEGTLLETVVEVLARPSCRRIGWCWRSRRRPC